jgi:Uma2 family endonuclease
MQDSRVKLTYDDLQALPEDGKRYELFEGELHVSPSPGSPHQVVSANLNDVLRAHVRARGIGIVLYAPLDCIFSDTTVLEPDLLYLDPSRMHLLTKRGIEGPPTLAVEIISPSSPRIDRHRKAQLYARFGVPNYWIVDPDARSIESFVLENAAYRLHAKGANDETIALPPFLDLSLRLGTIWA